MIRTDLELFGTGDACQFLNVSPTRLRFLVKSYDIPYYLTSSGKIFLKDDLVKFQENRKDKMKFCRKK